MDTDRDEILAKIRELRAELADAAERIAAQHGKGKDVSQLRIRTEQAEAELYWLIRLVSD